MSSNFDKLHTGELYDPGEPEIMDKQNQALDKMFDFNHTRPSAVKIGKNCWIGAGSVVVKDIPSNVVAVGNPCKVIRKIGENDAHYYYKDKKISEI
jgi:hypothetical protein